MIKRMDIYELTEKCKEIFYDYLVNGKEFCIGSTPKPIKEGFTPIDYLYGMNLKKLQDNQDRIKMIEEILSSIPKETKFCDLVYKEMIEALEDEQKLLKETNAKTQRARYNKTKILDYARSTVRIPLNKKINSLYDDFILEVLFYDDVTTLGGRYNEYKSLPIEERKGFVQKAISITHLGLFLPSKEADGINCTIRVYGNQKEHTMYHRYAQQFVSKNIILESKYADFSKLTLVDTMEIKNNDLRQILQDKLDLDNMNLQQVAEKEIGNDKYSVLLFNESGKKHYFIRYVCPSTSRVYFNEIDLKNLALSEYFKNNDCNSWIDSWWSIAHLGASPESKAMIRC